jgi:hypothetical protein
MNRFSEALGRLKRSPFGRLVIQRPNGGHVVAIFADGRTMGIQAHKGTNGRIKLTIEAPADVTLARPEHDRRLRGLHFAESWENGGGPSGLDLRLEELLDRSDREAESGEGLRGGLARAPLARKGGRR